MSFEADCRHWSQKQWKHMLRVALENLGREFHRLARRPEPGPRNPGGRLDALPDLAMVMLSARHTQRLTCYFTVSAFLR